MSESLTYGIPTSIWIRLPSDDQAAVRAEFLGLPPPQIGGYATPTVATPAPPPTLSGAGAAGAATGSIVGKLEPKAKNATPYKNPEVVKNTLAVQEGRVRKLGIASTEAQPTKKHKGFADRVENAVVHEARTATQRRGEPAKTVGHQVKQAGKDAGEVPAGTTRANVGHANRGLEKGGVVSEPSRANVRPKAPGASRERVYTYRHDVRLESSRTLAFRRGKGYYAMDAQARPKQPTREARAALRRDPTREIQPSKTGMPVPRAGIRVAEAVRTLQGSVSSRSHPMSPDAKAAARLTAQALKSPVIKQRAFDLYVTLMSIGFTRVQASAFLGNFFVESNYTLSPGTPQIGGGPGRGFAQWSINQGPSIGRWGLENTFAKQERMGKFSFATELDFMVAELSGILPHATYYYDNFENVKAELAHANLANATNVVMLKYEQEPLPKTARIRAEEHLDRRQAAAGVVHATLDASGQAILALIGRPVLDAIGQALIQRLKAHLR